MAKGGLWKCLIVSVMILSACSQREERAGAAAQNKATEPTFSSTQLRATNDRLTDYVNPFIGTSNFGATHPGAVMPHGLASVAPFNTAFGADGLNSIEKDSRWNSAVYVHENKFLTGFSHLNLSGVGCPEYGVILSMPVVGELELDPKNYGSTYKDETASPGYYAVTIDKGDVRVEATATKRAGATRYHLPAGRSNLIVSLGLGLTNETGANVRLVGEREFEGSRTIGTFCYNPEDVRPVYFAARLLGASIGAGLFKKAPKYKGVEAEWIGYDNTYKPYGSSLLEVSGDDVGVYFEFELDAPETVFLQVGLSFVSVENAWANLDSEQADQTFDEILENAAGAWDEMLRRVRVEGSANQKTLFYSALYHALLHPSVISDVNGEYPKMGGGVGKLEEGLRYSVFSLWDTYRTVHPFLSLVYPEIQSSMIDSMLGMYIENGWLPKWELAAMETNVMVGDPALPVIADTYNRGIRDFDAQLALEAMIKHAETEGDANQIRPFMDDYLSLGYVPIDREDQWGGSVSSAIEYAIADWNVAQLAEALGEQDVAERFLKQSLKYRTYFDADTGMLRPKERDGSFVAPFNPEAGKNFEPVPGFVEGTAWNYRFYAPHDINGLIELNGGAEPFLVELDRLFDTENFDMANEPDINYPFLYNYLPGHEYRTAERVDELVSSHYGIGANGLPGNDDAGTLSAWLLFAMSGIYPVTPGDPNYAAFYPQLEEVEIALNPEYYSGESLIIRRAERPFGAGFLQFNGETLSAAFVNHNLLVQGGVLEISGPQKSVAEQP